MKKRAKIWIFTGLIVVYVLCHGVIFIPAIWDFAFLIVLILCGCWYVIEASR